MNFSNLLRNTILPLADKTTASLQSKITHRAWTGESVDGTATFIDVVRYAAVKREYKNLKSSEGKSIESNANLIFPREIPPNGAKGRMEPVDPRDLFILPDKTEWPVVSTEGVFDRDTNVPYYTEVYLGSSFRK